MLVSVKSVSKTSGLSNLIASLSQVNRLVPPRLEVEVVCDMLLAELLRSIAVADDKPTIAGACGDGLNFSTVVET